MSDMQNQNKLDQLEEWFKDRKGSIVAFSGGIDSTLVLFLARKFQGKDNAIGVISNSESLKAKDFELAQNFCRDFDIKLEVIKTEELVDERYNQNPENRCYFCKEHLFHYLQQIKEKYPDFDVLSGTNHDDLGDYRPGLQAAAQYKVLAPMAQCQLTKEEIRDIARSFDLPNWDKPASPCLSSRIPYNHHITREKLQQVEAAENFLNELGFVDVRVRHYGSYGQVEVQQTEIERLFAMENQVVSQIKNLGFQDVKIDREGLVSGKLNRVIKGINQTETK
ncbi:ATP-dependent sacrificial sulfur transferase LarE [Mangrovibacterium lignilyticum]|uniref:ATP-dependent sacrificial sulfur transferase LarE n=1 Tax=Mangrovibacterium lignilyticum TaxID=2668052 RepID=UPI001967E2A0|nr:ATP-dependent sacrificial sulfur transferase LarE [Mangrovibacterium lignilyticum]